MLSKAGQSAVVFEVGVTEDQRVYTSDLLLPQEGCDDSPTRIKRLTREPPASMTMTWEPGNSTTAASPCPASRKETPQLRLKIALGQPVQTVTANQAERAGEKDSPQSRWLEASVEQEGNTEGIKQKDLKKREGHRVNGGKGQSCNSFDHPHAERDYGSGRPHDQGCNSRMNKHQRCRSQTQHHGGTSQEGIIYNSAETLSVGGASRRD